MIRRPPRSTRTATPFPYTPLFRSVSALPVTNAMSEKLRLQEPIRSPLETPRLITPLPYRSGTSFLAWAIVNNNQPVPDVFSKMTKIAASGRLGLLGDRLLASEQPPPVFGTDRLYRRRKERPARRSLGGGRQDRQAYDRFPPDVSMQLCR